MAKENIEQEPVEEAVKPAEMSPEESTNEASEKSESTGSQEIENLISVLNEIDKVKGGKGEIKSIPPELHNAIKLAVGYLTTIRDLYDDPLYKDVMDDMHEQRIDGHVPSLLVAVARNVPMEELQRVADEEGYEDVQKAVTYRVSKEKENEDSEKTLYRNFDTSKKNIDDYCSESGYDDARKQALYATISMLRNCFADGLLTKEEIAKIDKIDNYDSDIQTLKSQVPTGGVKTVLPDKASIDESMAQKKTPAPVQNSIDNAASYQTPAYMETGKRKIFKKN